MPKLLATVVLAAALVVAVVVGLRQAGGTGTTTATTTLPSRAEQQQRLAGAPAPLAALHAQAGQLLEGSLERRLRTLRGHPVVVNIWASWCGPCRQEMPIVADVALRRGRTVGFLGLDSRDGLADGRSFLARVPVSYPSYHDPSERQTHALAGSVGLPTTVFVNARGRTTYVHQGPYATARALEADMATYLPRAR